MSIPASLLQHAEAHPCFSGCYGSDPDVSVCLDAARPLSPLLVVSCHDCFARLGVPRALVPTGATANWLAGQLTQHLRKQRGFSLSFSGYHTKGPGFWLSAAYYSSCGLYLLNGERSRALGTDLELLVLAFRHGIAAPPDPRMLDPRLYTTQEAYVRFTAPMAAIASRQALVTSPHCRSHPAPGFQRVTLAEFQPAARTPGHPPPQTARSQSAAAPTAAGTLRPGDICPVCGAEYRVRALLQGTYLGCLC
jgi:hypothetical protein